MDSVRSRLQPSRDRVLLAFLVAGAAGQAVIALRLARRSWFGVDAVAYLTTRGPVPSANEGLFRPYGGHWQTIPLLVYRLLFHVVGLRSYLPYVAVALALHLAIVFVLHALLRSVGASSWTAALTAWLVLFYGAGAEAFMWDAPMVLTSSLLLGLVASLVMVRSHFSNRSRVVAAALLLAAVMCSGTGLAAAVMVGLFALFRAGLRAAVLVGGPAIAAFSVWFFTIGRDGRVHVTSGSLPHVPAYVWSGLTGSLGSVLGIPGTGGALLLVLLVVLVLPHVPSVALRQLAVAAFVGGLTQLVLSSFATATAVGEAAARVGRYEYLAFVMMAASVALALEVLWQQADRGSLGAAARGVLPVVAVLLLAATTLQGISQERRYADFGAASARLYRSWVYGSVLAADAGEKQLVNDADIGFNGGRFELFAAPQLRSRLPAGPSTPENRLVAESEYFVDVTPDDPGLSGSTSITVQGLQGSLRPHGCLHLTTDGTAPPTVDVHVGNSGTQVEITSDSTLITTQLFRAYVPSPVRGWGASPGSVYVATTARDATMRVVLSGSGSVVVCLP